MVEQWLDIVRFVRCLLRTIRVSLKSWRDSNSMVHLLDDMVVAEQGWLLRLTIVFWLFRHKETVFHLQPNFVLTFEMHVSTQTIRSRLHERCLRTRRPCIRIPMSGDNCRLRYDCAMDPVGKSRRHVLFSDESRYCLDYTDRRARVLQRSWKRFNTANIA
jgi:hypothetical protein